MLKMTEQHIPIFVGSTFEDLKEHRRKVRETLGRLETYVKGMEQFGATSEDPLEKCLAEVNKCKIYVGIFGMRYGAIPQGYDKSFTHLEYERAQKRNLPSLIFIQDENHPVLPKYIDKDEKAQKLSELKNMLKTNHTCDFFTTPEDLASKVATSVANELEKLKTTEEIIIENGYQEVIPQQSTLSPEKILRRAKILPLRWNGIEFTAEFCNASDKQYGFIMPPRPADEIHCNVLDLPYNHSICVQWALHESPLQYIWIFAKEELADQIIDIDRNSIITAKMETAYIYINHDDFEPETVLRIKEIIDIKGSNKWHCEDIPF
jgi:hypothetical protein